MSLVLQNVHRNVDGNMHLEDINLSFDAGSFNVLLGRTLAGKTSLLRVIAGLDKPSKGRVILNDIDITSKPVQQRNLSMVYQQFINYPNQTVAENIASPLKIAKVKPHEITKRVNQVAELMHIGNLLERYPNALSGGQQQRCAMARALVKDGALILFDEPLVNLDYKLREELRRELKALFKARDSIAIYATTEAHEALALGGTTSLLHQGKVLQTGPAFQQYSFPASLNAADLFHEPPLNRFPANIANSTLIYAGQKLSIADTHLQKLQSGQYCFAIRPDHILMQSSGEPEIVLDGLIDLAELSASETYLHLSVGKQAWVVLLLGIHPKHTQEPATLYLPLRYLYAFEEDGQALVWPLQDGQLFEALV